MSGIPSAQVNFGLGLRGHIASQNVPKRTLGGSFLRLASSHDIKKRLRFRSLSRQQETADRYLVDVVVVNHFEARGSIDDYRSVKDVAGAVVRDAVDDHFIAVRREC